MNNILDLNITNALLDDYFKYCIFTTLTNNEIEVIRNFTDKFYQSQIQYAINSHNIDYILNCYHKAKNRVKQVISEYFELLDFNNIREQNVKNLLIRMIKSCNKLVINAAYFIFTLLILKHPLFKYSTEFAIIDTQLIIQFECFVSDLINANS
jgi:hypothetical protein